METCEKKIKVPTTGMFDFPRLVEEDKGKYVDKTNLFYVGVNYDPATRGIDDPLVEPA